MGPGLWQRTRRRMLLLVAATVIISVHGSVAASIAVAAGAPTFSVLREIQAAHHPGFDRIVFEFSGPAPERASARWSGPPREDGSGRLAHVQGDAFITVVFSGAVGHASTGSRSTIATA